MRATLATLTLALVLATPAAGFAQNKVEQQMFAELRMMQEQIKQQQLVINSLAESIKAVTAKQDEQANAVRKSFADAKLLTDNITDSIRILREKGDDTNVRIATVSRDVELMRQAMQSLQSSVTQALAVATAAAGTPAGSDSTAPGTPPQTTPTSAASTQSPKVLYDQAYGDFAATRYEYAIQGFKAYLLTFPTSPDAYQAQFYVGESYFNQGNYNAAEKAYTEMITTYKNTLWTPDAYYKRGISNRELGKKDQARADLQYVIKNFPDNTLAPLAKAALDGIK